MNKKFVYQVGNNKKVILWCTANQISRIHKYRVVIFIWPVSYDSVSLCCV